MRNSKFPGWMILEEGDVMEWGDAMCYRAHQTPDNAPDTVRGYAGQIIPNGFGASVYRKGVHIYTPKVAPLPLP